MNAKFAKTAGVFLSILFVLAFYQSAAAQTPLSVSIGGAVFTSSPIKMQNGVSILNIGISTGVDVTNNAVATVRVEEQTNFGGVDYMIDSAPTNSRRKSVALAGGGKSTTLSFTFRTTSDNAYGGTIVNKVILESVTNARKGGPDSIQNLNLVVSGPTSSARDEFVGCFPDQQFRYITCRCDLNSSILGSTIFGLC